MARLNHGDQVESLRRKQAEITEKLRVAEEIAKKTKRENAQRRHEIAGNIFLAAVSRDPQSDFARAAIVLLESEIKTQSQRNLFPELPPIANEARAKAERKKKESKKSESTA